MKGKMLESEGSLRSDNVQVFCCLQIPHISGYFSSSYPFNLLHLREDETLPEINTWNTLVVVGLINASDSAAREEDSDERGVFAAWPVLDREDERICVMLWRIGELEEAVQWNLEIREGFGLYKSFEVKGTLNVRSKINLKINWKVIQNQM